MIWTLSTWESRGQVYLVRIGERGDLICSEFWHEAARFTNETDAAQVVRMIDSLRKCDFAPTVITARCGRTS